MPDDDISEWLINAIGTAIILLVAIKILNTLFILANTNPVAPFYPAQQYLVTIIPGVISLAAPGIVGAGVLLATLIIVMNQSDGL